MISQRNGPEFEANMVTKEAGNPKFAFLFPGQPGHDMFMQRKLIRGVGMPVPMHATIERRRQALTVSEVKEVSSYTLLF